MKIETFVKNTSLVEKFVEFLCSELKIYPTKICISSYEEDNDILGMCIDESPNEYIVLVKEKDRNIGEVFTTIAHEMIHVKQYMRENLGWFLDNRSHIPYHDRWWEKEAFTQSVPLVEKFAKGLKV